MIYPTLDVPFSKVKQRLTTRSNKEEYRYGHITGHVNVEARDSLHGHLVVLWDHKN